MATRDLTIGLVFLSQVVFGILGNFSLSYHYLFLHFTGHSLRCTDLIIRHLIIANFLVILSKGVPHIMVAFGVRRLPSATECMLIFHVQRMARATSIGTTCLLGLFQAIAISPMNSSTDSLYVALLLFIDVVYFVLMFWASGFMVSILYRHKQRVQHVRRSRVTSQSSPESRATQNILVLVSTFVFCNTLSSAFQDRNLEGNPVPQGICVFIKAEVFPSGFLLRHLRSFKKFYQLSAPPQDLTPEPSPEQEQEEEQDDTAASQVQ
ncbi:vomeronasal type-1 receptor 3-like [Pteronotus mesoamericanus]|uniref:vomeronasal type-1 receptor 3-like n=1 Tax=Pteronotus mesoamericanus TaxID=1884717 RepID=UPI0023ED5F21|nr:vomeronasal type-1 receptor 3-like [Pteronotus parnellii mesoamericanus]